MPTSKHAASRKARSFVQHPLRREQIRLEELVSREGLALFRDLCADSIRTHGRPEDLTRFEGAWRSRRSDLLLELATALERRAFQEFGFHFGLVQISQLLKKYPYQDFGFHGLDPEGTARKTFHASEHRCRRFNSILRGRLLLRSPEENAPFMKMRDVIWELLGESPDLNQIYRNCGFGPGAAIGCGGDATSLLRKILAEPTCSPTALPYFIAATKKIPLWREITLGDESTAGVTDLCQYRKELVSIVQYTEYNKVGFVPKTAKTHRSIAVEPLWNSYVQKGVDLVLRHKLHRKWGIDLTDQSRNKVMAGMGSLRWHPDPYCTIDLSSASDSISIELVKGLLPKDWFGLLDRLRSPSYVFEDGETPTRYHKFVSMGNGFCFPLQSLIFSAVCRAAGCPLGDFSVYGDDIIVRRSRFPEVVRLLGSIGFRINVDKTYNEGFFRESCGADWYDGTLVRPLIIDKPLTNLSALFSVCNYSLRNEKTAMFFSEFRERVMRLLDVTRMPFVRPFIGSESTALEVPHDVALANRHVTWNSNLQSLEWNEILPIPVEDTGPEWLPEKLNASIQLMAALRGHPSNKPFVMRRQTHTRIRRVAYAGTQSTWVPQGHHSFNHEWSRPHGEGWQMPPSPYVD